MKMRAADGKKRLTDVVNTEQLLRTRQYKNLKDLKKENLCDNMSDLELVTDIVADAAALPERNKEKDKNE